MTFKKGISGNPKGRPVGALSKRAQLAKLLEPHAPKLIEKMIELALDGDVNALRLCIERLIPKVQHEAMSIDLPEKLNQDDATHLKSGVLAAALEGQMAVTDAEKLIQLIDTHATSHSVTLSSSSYALKTTDPLEASRVYQKLMG